ncbi:Stealth CR1 domain-containing protein [Tenacibaculum ovolyticum]|uniref:Stealth CR1 domain-containing protein n=1 Tax=Tenacibaculum ovolyticum TaxID=104270 RepID=UPI00041210DF|nr:Stealth CR1 domain-containing protein [Tenacibaculum ovolyticum]
MKIDAVITWVDGNDSNHIKKMAKYLPDDTNTKSRDIKDRYSQVNEIEYAVKSIMKFAEFINKIFIVTDNQTPEFIKGVDYPNVIIIDHKEIFGKYTKYLPTFNCLPIETMMVNIPNLSERFIYFNDDCFLSKRVEITDFFIEEKPVLRGRWENFYENIWYEKIKKRVTSKERKYGYKLGQQNIARELGFNKYFKFDHTPHPLRKSTIQKYFKINKDLEEINVKHRFRHVDQFTLQGLANHLEIRNNTCVLKHKYQLLYIQSYKKPLFYYKLRCLISLCNKNVKFVCLQSLDKASNSKLVFFKEWLTKVIS